jgi:CBS domain containing-hemolysin-like protein
LQQNLDVARDSGYTRYPVCEGDKDHIIGMIHIKDLLGISAEPEADLRSITRPIINIPETKPIDELLKELQKSHSHQAVVLDEYGGTSGLVTLEDIIEELIGEIQDEHDKPPSFEVIDEDKDIYDFAGTISIDDVADKLEIEISNPADYETIGGYALYELHIAPRLGASAHLDGYDVGVIEVAGRRIKRLRFTKREEEPTEAEKAEAGAREKEASE